MPEPWRHEHGSEYAVPEGILDLIRRRRLHDWSYHNDTCPRFCTIDPHASSRPETGRALWVEHPDPSKWEDTLRFCVQRVDGEGCWMEDLLSTDDLSQALAVVLLAD